MEPNSRLWGYLKRAFQSNKNTEVYWLPKAGGKENPAARQLVLFTFTYGDTRKKQAHTTAGNHQDEKLRLWAFPPLLNPPYAQSLSWHSLLFAHVNVSFSIYSSHFVRIKELSRHVLQLRALFIWFSLLIDQSWKYMCHWIDLILQTISLALIIWFDLRLQYITAPFCDTC